MMGLHIMVNHRVIIYIFSIHYDYVCVHLISVLPVSGIESEYG